MIYVDCGLGSPDPTLLIFNGCCRVRPPGSTIRLLDEEAMP
jgi:hypothetical protein